MQKHRLEHWLKNIHTTLDHELSCSECFDLVSHFVEVELSGGDAAGSMPLLKQHLDQCPACRGEYETLRELHILENKGELPSLNDLEDLIP